MNDVVLTEHNRHTLEREKTVHALLHKPPGPSPYVIPRWAAQRAAPDLFRDRNICILLQKHSGNDGRGDESFASKAYDLVGGKFPFAVSLHAIREYDEKHFHDFRPNLPVDPLSEVALRATQSPTLVIHGPCLKVNLEAIKKKLPDLLAMSMSMQQSGIWKSIHSAQI